MGLAPAPEAILVTPAWLMAEEEVMRKRLAVEGDGGGDDRRVMSLLKTFVRWCNSNALSDEESEATYQKMLFTLGESVHFSSCLCVYV